MLHRQRHEAERGMAAEDAAEIFETFDDDGIVQRTPLGATYERYDGGRNDRYDISVVFRSRRAGAEVERFGRHSARGSEKRLHDSWRRPRLQHWKCQ
jgi:hypothetical protein